jgi:hypothetical protein
MPNKSAQVVTLRHVFRKLKDQISAKTLIFMMHISCGLPQTLQACAGVISLWLHSALLCRKQQNIRASEMETVKSANKCQQCRHMKSSAWLSIVCVCVCVCWGGGGGGDDKAICTKLALNI